MAAPVGGAYRWWKEVECAQRGVFRLGPHHLRIGDPFGLFAGEIRYDRSETVLIYPRVVQLPQVELPRGSAGGSAPRRRPMLGVLPAASVRDYAQGDSMRHIHWPSTARRSQLMVKELELEPSGDVWIVLNLHDAVQRGEGRTGTLEYSIILAASMAAEMVSGRERRAVGLLTSSGDDVIALPPQPGQAQLWAVMAALAPAQPTTWSLAELLRRNMSALGRRHTLIVVTPAATAPARAGTERPGRGVAPLPAPMTLLTAVMATMQEPVQDRCGRRLDPAAGAGAARGSGVQCAVGGHAGGRAGCHRTGAPADDALDIPAQVLRTDMPLRAALTYRRKRKVIRTTPTGGAYTVEVEEEVG